MMSGVEESSSAICSPARLHVLKLHESPILESGRNHERFSMQWMLVDSAGSGKPKVIADKDPAEWNAIEEGDVLYFPELLSGAGEFEGMRFAGSRFHEDSEIRLLRGGVEYPEFPREIISIIENRHGTSSEEKSKAMLRHIYESPFREMINQQGISFTLNDVFGGDEDGFWSDPPIQRQNERRLTAVEEWKIPLDECTWIGTF